MIAFRDLRVQKYLLPALIFITALSLSSCSQVRHLNDTEVLIKKTEVIGIKGPIKAEAEEVVQVKPNTRILMFSRFYLWLWNLGQDIPKSGMGRFLSNKMGEEPAILDSAKIEDDRFNINRMLFHNGFYNNEVAYEVKVKRKQANIKYKIIPRDQYRLREVKYMAHDRNIHRILQADSASHGIKPGMHYHSDALSAERVRISGVLRNRGYFFFAPEFIDFKVDTTLQGNLVDILLVVKNPGLYQLHEVFKIKDVYVSIDVPEGSRYYFDDTLGEQFFPEARYNGHGYPINPQVILRNLQYRSGQIYRADDVAATYSRLASLSIFSLVNQRFERDTLITDSMRDEGISGLKAIITLIPGKRQGYSIEPQFITSERANTIDNSDIRNFGIGANFSYTNRNAFKNGETFELSYRLSLESQFQQADTLPFFSVVQHNVNATIFVPRLWLFRKILVRPDNVRPRSSIGLGFIYESNFDFLRRVFSINNSYTFTRGLSSYTFTPYEASYNTTDPKRNFFAGLSTVDSIFIVNQFAAQYIGNIRFIWSRNTARNPAARDYNFIRFLAEESGTAQHALWKLTGQQPNANGQYTIFGVPYTNYIKFDVDLRKGISLSPNTQSAFRLHTGAGFAYGNSAVVPYVRRYFVGGANSLRGWRQGALGPGSFQAPPGSTPERSGEMIIEAQGEYRFSLIEKRLHMALFADAGNVWYTGNDPNREGTEFRIPSSFREFGLNGGIGARIDFTFFILRFDFGLPAYDPAQNEGERWVVNRWFNSNYAKNGVLNFAIGYPF